MRTKLQRVLSIALGWSVLVASFVVVSIAGTQREAGAAVATGFVMEQYVTGVPGVIDLDWAPNGLLFAATKQGTIHVVDNGTQSLFVDISAQVNSGLDRGLLGLAVHPGLTTGSPYIYAVYTYDPPEAAGGIGNASRDGDGQRVSRVSRFTANAATGFTTLVPGSEVVILGAGGNWTTIGSPGSRDTDNSPNWACGNRINVRDCVPADASSHTIGTIDFGADGMLYVGNGDAATFAAVTERSFRTLDLDSLAGKILRIDPITGDGVVSNPYWDGDAQSNRSKVFQLGTRNPFRFTAHPSGELWIADVGDANWEEVNQAAPGADFGWPCYEGGAAGSNAPEPAFAATVDCANYYADNAAVPPVYSYPRAGGAAIMATDFGIGISWPAEYQDALIVPDFDRQTIDAVQVRNGTNSRVTLATAVLVTDAVFGPDGHLYVASIGASAIERIRFTGGPQNQAPTAAAGADTTVVDANGDGSEVVTLNGSGSTDPDGTIVDWSWSVGGSVVATGVVTSATFPVGTSAVTLTVTDDAGATGTDLVNITVDAPPSNLPPVANAGADVTVEDTDGNGSQNVTLNGSASSDPDGTIVNYSWRVGATEIATGVSPSLAFGVGATNVTLVVTDDGGATAQDVVLVTVEEPVAPPPPPPPPPSSNITVDKAELDGNRLRIEGAGANGGARIIVDGVDMGAAQNNGNFRIRQNHNPSGCTVSVSDGSSTVFVDLDGC